MVKCPWCSKTVKEYAKHLQEHYVEKDGKMVGPYPAGVPK